LVLLFAVSVARSGEVIGREFDFDGLSDVDEREALMMVNGAEGGATDALYYGGLLALYGKGGVAQSSARAVAYFRQAAEQGHAASQTALGRLLRHGVGVKRDDDASFAWLSRAARAGHPDASWLLGVAYFERNDTATAKEWLLLSTGGRGGGLRDDDATSSAEVSPDAAHWLGVVAEYEGDFPEARRWYEKASARGHTEATFHLGLLRAYGRGCDQDLTRAAILFQKAASEKQHAGATFYLALMHLYGHGGLRVNYDAARHWFQRAEATNDAAFAPKAAEARRELEHSLAMATSATQGTLDKLLKENERRF